MIMKNPPNFLTLIISLGILKISRLRNTSPTIFYDFPRCKKTKHNLLITCSYHNTPTKLCRKCSCFFFLFLLILHTVHVNIRCRQCKPTHRDYCTHTNEHMLVMCRERNRKHLYFIIKFICAFVYNCVFVCKFFIRYFYVSTSVCVEMFKYLF